MWYLIGGLGFLAFTAWEMRKGDADLLFWVGEVGIDITGERNPILFWATMVGQIALSVGVIVWGVFTLM